MWGGRSRGLSYLAFISIFEASQPRGLVRCAGGNSFGGSSDRIIDNLLIQLLFYSVMPLPEQNPFPSGLFSVRCLRFIPPTTGAMKHFLQTPKAGSPGKTSNGVRCTFFNNLAQTACTRLLCTHIFPPPPQVQRETIRGTPSTERDMSLCLLCSIFIHTPTKREPRPDVHTTR